MRRALLGSLIFHIALTIGFFQWIAFSRVKYVPRDVYTVKLVGSVAQARAAAPQVQTAPPKPVEEKKAEEPPEEKEEQMPAPPEKPKPPKPKSDRKSSTVPTTDIRKTDTKPDSALAGAGEGVPGPPGDTPSMGSVSIDGGDFPFASYIARMRQKIATTWVVPPGTEGFERGAVVYFRIHRNGSVSDVSVEKSSTLPLFDRSCQRAVIEAAPMPPLPREYRDDYVGVHFSFLYQPSQ